MIKKYRLKVPQLGLPAGTEFERKEGTTFTGAFIEANPTVGAYPIMLSCRAVEDNPDIFEPVIERWKPGHGELYWALGDLAKCGPFRYCWDDIDHDWASFNAGDCFRTQEQAEEAAKRIKDALMKYHAELDEEAQ